MKSDDAVSDQKMSSSDQKIVGLTRRVPSSASGVPLVHSLRTHLVHPALVSRRHPMSSIGELTLDDAYFGRQFDRFLVSLFDDRYGSAAVERCCAGHQEW